MTFKAKIKNGKMEFEQRYLKFFYNLIRKLEGEYVRVSIEKWKEKRSDNQNRYYWGVVLKMLSDKTGHHPDELHEAFIKKFLSHKVILGEVVSERSSSLTTTEFEEYMSKIRTFASHPDEGLNTFIPLPNEAPVGFAYDSKQLKPRRIKIIKL